MNWVIRRLLQISRGMPVGALVFGRRSIEADVWLPDGSRLGLDRAVVVGNTIQRLTPSSKDAVGSREPSIGSSGCSAGVGQEELAECRVGIIGLGGIGSLVAEYLARLGVGHFCLVDDDRSRNRICRGSSALTLADARIGVTKVSVARSA